MSLAPGARLGPYEILGRLGAGGMGEVWRARDPRLDREVAIKVLPPSFAGDPERLDRFAREARAVAALSHPNILVVHELGEFAGTPYLVAELVPGETLRQRLARGALPTREAVALALQLARGIGAAHARGIVHRDLKPENVVLTPDGTLKILDFGLARPALAGMGDDDATALLTREGMIVGSLGYMAPEQVRGEPADARADLFACGALLYEMLTGERAFGEGSPADVLASILRAEPRGVASEASPIPAPLRRVLRRALAKRADERFASAAELAAALSAAIDGSGPIPGGAQAAPEASLAVLPFTDLSPGQDQGWFCDGLAEELMHALGRSPGLRVASRTAAFACRGGHDPGEIGRRLDVGHLLDGAVRRAGDRLRVTVQLVRTGDGSTLWSQRYDRELADVFAIQDEIAGSVARELQVVLGRRAEADAPRDVAAYEFYLRGREQMWRTSRIALAGAREHFRRALELDPGYARAWAGLADICSWRFLWFAGTAEDVREADAASARALELCPDLPEAHAARALALSIDGRYDDSEAELAIALRLDPGLFEGHYYGARNAIQRGRFEEALARFDAALRVRPEDYSSAVLKALALRGLGREEEHLAAHRLAAEIIERRLDDHPDDVRALYLGAGTLVVLGERERGIEWAERALAVDPEECSAVYNVGCVMMNAGEHERGLALLEQCVAGGFGQVDWIAHDPDWEPVREHPRFLAALEVLRRHVASRGAGGVVSAAGNERPTR